MPPFLFGHIINGQTYTFNIHTTRGGCYVRKCTFIYGHLKNHLWKH